jgi:RimJ/RimL family protein N-acetyltransferase
VLRTERLILRDWRDDDVDPFTAMSRDPEVMEFFPKLLERDEVAVITRRVRAAIALDGFGFWAVERAGELIGYCGISRVTFAAHFTPAVEIGWRFARHAWGHGYATEAARASLEHGWAIGLQSIVAFLVPDNRRSAAVAERIGMRRDPEGDFDHPSITPGARSVGGHPNQRHALYRLDRPLGQNSPTSVIDPAKT